MSNFKLCDTFRTAVGDCPAARARLGSPSFVNLNKNSLVPTGLIAKLISQHRPTCIKHGFSHPGFCKLGATDIADDDQLVFASYLSACLVELVLSNIRNLGMDSLDATFVTGALLNSKRSLILAIVLQGRDNVSVAARRECLQSEINSDFTVAGWQIVRDLALETDIPPPASVLGKAAGLDGVGDIPRFPEMEFALEVNNVCVFDFHGATDKGQPSESALGATTGAETRGMACSIAGYHKLLAYLTDRIGVQPKISGAAGSQFDKIEVRRPSTLGRTGFVIALNLALNFATVVPDKIDRTRVATEMLPDRRVFDAVLESQNHADYIFGLRRDFK